MKLYAGKPVCQCWACRYANWKAKCAYREKVGVAKMPKIPDSPYVYEVLPCQCPRCVRVRGRQRARRKEKAAAA